MSEQMTCSQCEKNNISLLECKGCGAECCEKCLVDLTPHNMIDFPFCKTCYEAGESSE